MNTQAAGRLEKGDKPSLIGRVNLETVTGLLAAADALYADGRKDCVIDLAGLEDSDSATVALLLEWKRRAVNKGCTLTFTSIPTRLIDIARISQLDALLAN